MAAYLKEVNYSDEDHVMFAELCAKIRENLDAATFEGKRRIIELLDVHGTLAV